jgi:uncharacterized membrane protein HdeD (DUF308 family)
MRVVLAKNWWSLVLRAMIAISIGIVSFLLPWITVTALVFLFGGYALIDCASSLACALRAAEPRARWRALLIEGIVGVVAGW